MEVNIQEIVKKIDKLPNHFHVAVRVSKMLEGDHSELDIHELTKIISLDQSLTSQLLKLCNSAHYGFSRKISSIGDAVTKIGFKTIKNLVYLAVSQSVLSQEIKGYSLDKGELWRNSVSCAVYAKYIAQKVKYKDPETAFTAGLLKDIGKLVIHEYVGINYNEIVSIINANNLSFIDAENKILGFDHCLVGSEMAVQWNFPPVLVDVIKYHHSPIKAVENGAEDIDLISIVHISDSLAMMLGNGLGNDGMMYGLELKALEYLKIPLQAGGIEELIAEAAELNDDIDSLVGNI